MGGGCVDVCGCGCGDDPPYRVGGCVCDCVTMCRHGHRPTIPLAYRPIHTPTHSPTRPQTLLRKASFPSCFLLASCPDTTPSTPAAGRSSMIIDTGRARVLRVVCGCVGVGGCMDRCSWSLVSFADVGRTEVSWWGGRGGDFGDWEDCVSVHLPARAFARVCTCFGVFLCVVRDGDVRGFCVGGLVVRGLLS